MKFSDSIFAIAATLLSALTSAAPLQAPSNSTGEIGPLLLARGVGSARFQDPWPDGAYIRYRFTFSGVSESDYGQDFFDSLHAHGGTTHNWQCWQDSNGVWTFDDSEGWGIVGAGIIGDSVRAVMGQSCLDLG